MFFCDGHRSPTRLFLPSRISTRNRTRATNESRFFPAHCITPSLSLSLFFFTYIFFYVSYTIDSRSHVHASRVISIYRTHTTCNNGRLFPLIFLLKPIVNISNLIVHLPPSHSYLLRYISFLSFSFFFFERGEEILDQSIFLLSLECFIIGSGEEIRAIPH